MLYSLGKHMITLRNNKHCLCSHQYYRTKQCKEKLLHKNQHWRILLFVSIVNAHNSNTSTHKYIRITNTVEMIIKCFRFQFILQFFGDFTLSLRIIVRFREFKKIGIFTSEFIIWTASENSQCEQIILSYRDETFAFSNFT